MAWTTVAGIADSGAGWLFMVAVLCLVAASYMAPVVIRAWEDVMKHGAPKYTTIKTNTELRMLLGFTVILLSGAFFASYSFVRSVILEAGDFETARQISHAMAWALAPVSLGFCIGLAMILWDGLGRRGGHICIFLIGLAAACWAAGSIFEQWLVRTWWG